ncbi:MAG: NlpC/P60 family protein [Oscillospiraceae bacterium]|nr:NlpC/P60 family protein [Oscillospiraceae bacterium]
MAEKPVRLRFTEDDLADKKVAKAATKAEKAADKADKAVSRLPTKRRLRREPATAGSKKSKLRRESTAAAKSKEKLRFGKLKIEEVEAPKPRARGKHAATKAPLDTVSGTAHKQISQYEDDNVGVQAAHQSEEAVEGTTHVTEQAVYSNKLRKYEKAEKLVRKSDNANVEALYQKFLKENPEAATNPLSRWMQKQQIKREYAAARAAAQTGKATTSTVGTAKTVESAREKGESVLASIKGFFTKSSSGVKVALILCLVVLLLITQLQSCSMLAGGMLTSVTATSWPAEDIEITKADAYYTKLEAQLQKKINNMESTHPNCDEFNYSIGEIGHDSTALISYLCAKYGDFTLNEVKSELDAIFALQYDLDVETSNETRTVTKTVQAGDYIGEVVTSGYCNCSICCGSWAGGPTASGVYPTANHTIAVDATNPIVPIGTQIIMNGVLYTVEGTGNFARYGVDFDVYYDSHSAALAHGHQTWQAYYAGGDGEEIEVTATETVKVCYVTLTVTDFESILTSRLTEEQLEMYDIYQETKGNRVIFGTPLDFNWHLYITGEYGYRCSGTSVVSSDCLDVTVPTGTEVLSVMDGTVKSVSGGTVTLKNDSNYIIKLGGLKNISVSAGEEVTTGQAIGKVGSSGVLTISFTYNGTSFNPYFYLDVGEGSLFGDVDVGDATGKAALLIAKAYQYLGVPYVWGGYSPSGFDCSGFVSYCINNCGAGWSVGRLTANGLLGICTKVSSSEAQPGDLIFFQGTYSTSGASHVGIYLGNGQMIHCGNPCQVSSINTSYWQQHFYCFARLPGM